MQQLLMQVKSQLILSSRLALTGGTLSGLLTANAGVSTNFLINGSVKSQRFIKEISWDMDALDSKIETLTNILSIPDLANEYKFLSVVSITVEDSAGNIHNTRGSQVYFSLSPTQLEISRESGSYFNSPLFNDATIRVVVEYNKLNA